MIIPSGYVKHSVGVSGPLDIVWDPSRRGWIHREGISGVNVLVARPMNDLENFLAMLKRTGIMWELSDLTNEIRVVVVGSTWVFDSSHGRLLRMEG